jgi:HEAT repeat protein
MVLKIAIGSLFLGFNALAGDFSEKALETAAHVEKAQPELAQWVNTLQPIRNRAGNFYFPGEALGQTDAQFLLMARLFAAKDTPEVRVSLAYALDSDTLIPWGQIAEETDPTVRAAMIHLAKKNKSPASAELIRQALLDPAVAVRTEAARLAGYLQPNALLDTALLTALKDPTANVRAFSARSLGWQNNSSSFEAIRRLLKDPEAAVRDRALQALAAIDTPRTQKLPELAGLQKDSHPALARRAQRLSK